MNVVSESQQHINQFRAQDESNFIFACQADVPLVLTADLLYQLWNNFKTYQYQFDPLTTFKISHFAVSDLLLSNLCREVGIGLYEMEREVRNELLLQLETTLGEKRKNTVALFLKDYAQLEYRFGKRKKLKSIHSLTAASFLDPSGMERQIIQMINESNDDREKLNYLLLHSNLIPIGFESELGKISREIFTADTMNLSPIMIAAEQDETIGVFNINVELPQLLKGKVFRSRRETAQVSKELSKAQKLINDCLERKGDFLNLSNCHLVDDHWSKDGVLNRLLKQCAPHLTSFILTGEHELYRLPTAVYELNNLEKLHFGGTVYKQMSFSEFPVNITDLSSLRFLDLSFNGFREIPHAIAKLKNLVGLNLEGNQLTTLPPEIGQLTNLKELNIRSNKIDSLPASIRQLTLIREFNIDENPILTRLNIDTKGLSAREIMDVFFSDNRANHRGSFVKEYGIGGTLMDVEVAEGFKDIPNNRTLIVVNLTGKMEVHPEVVTGLSTLTEVFHHYRPSISFLLKDEAGRTHSQDYEFRQLRDFSINELISRSSLLSNQEIQLDCYTQILRQLRNNKMFNTILGSDSDRVLLLTSIRSLMSIVKLAISNDHRLFASNDETEQVKSTTVEFELEHSLEALAKFGGYDFIESLIPGSENLNPHRKARRKIFLEDDSKRGERQNLADCLEIWQNIFFTNKDWLEIEKDVEKQKFPVEKSFSENLAGALFAIRRLEYAYRAVASFFDSAETSRANNVSFISADIEQLTQPENDTLINLIESELHENFDKLDLRHSYSLWVLPGFIGASQVLYRLAEIAYQNKVSLITDFDNLDDPYELMERFDETKFSGAEVYMSNVVMTCNWILGRHEYEQVTSDRSLFIPPSMALAGKIYNSPLTQITAGKKNAILGVEDVKFQLKKSEIASLEKLGLVPLVKEYRKIMPFSMRTLYNGENLGLQVYPIVQLFDYISKVIMDLLNRMMPFESFNFARDRNIRNSIVKFLDSITGPGKPIEKFTILRFEKNEVRKDFLNLDIQIMPYFPAKSFAIKFTNYINDDGLVWTTKYEQMR